MNKFINLIKTIFFFPLYVRKIHIINLGLQKRLDSLEKLKKIDEDNLTYLTTVMSSHLSKDCGINKDKRERDVTISLTSHSYKVDKVHLTIQSLMDQEFKADRIVLYLDEAEFNDSNLPNDLKLMVERGLTIDYHNDIGSYKKLIPALKQYPNDLLVTVDDDLIYPRSFLRKLYEAYLKEPQFIHCYRMHYIKFDASGKVEPYRKWDLESNVTEPGFLVFPTGVGGVLYPPNSLHNDVLKEDAFLHLSPGADDVWFKAMSLLNGVQCKKIDSDILDHQNSITIRGTQEIGLFHENLKNDKNDKKIENVFSAYNLWDKLKQKNG